MQMISPKDDAMIDIDNDGDLDLVVVGYTDIGWYENEGDEEFGSINMILEDVTGQYGIYPADVNADGYMDFAARYDDGSDKISWFQNMGDGTFTENLITVTETSAYYFLDDDADGDFDLIFSHMYDGIRRIPGNPGGTFGGETIIDDATYNYYQCYHTDFDNDGDQDLLFSTQAPEIEMKYAENLGDGTYAAAIVVLDGVAELVNQANFVDMDNDGDEDWILGTGFSEYYYLYYYENTGEDLAEPYDLSELVAGQIIIGDMDNDGYDDIVGMSSKSYHMWIKNNGDGTFEESVDFPMDIWADTGWLDALCSAHLHDLDGDGDLDVYGATVQDHFYFTHYGNLTISDYKATGRFFADLNDNGVWDPDEVGVGFPDMDSDPDPETVYVSPSGDYLVGFPILDDVYYTISPILPENWEISTPDLDYTVFIDGIEVWDSLDFGITPTEIVDSIGVELVGGTPRCNDTILYWLNVDNYGTTTPSGLISLELDDSLSFVSSALVPDSVVDQTVYWSYDSLSWYDNIQIPVRIATPDFWSEGDDVTSYLTASIIDDGVEIFEDQDSLVQIITCAYDPNDKVGFPFGVDEMGFISIDETTMEYTIRFQNTGSDTAFTVRIEDELDDAFNWDSFQVLAESHDMEWSIDGDGNVEFLFNDIMLPDSNVNFDGSQGFVKYQIEINEGSPSGTVLENTASIFFDFNPAIVTNTTVHTLFDCETILMNVDLPTTVCYGDSIIGETDGFTIPSTNVFTWEIGDVSVEGDDFAYLESESGVHEILVTSTTDFCEATESFFVEVLAEIPTTVLPSVSICPGDSTAIFGSFVSEAGVYMDSLITADSGCDSLVTQELMVYEVVEVTVSTTDDLLCVDEASVPLTGEPAGGVLEGTGVDGSNFDPTISGLGDFTVYYVFEDDNSCVIEDSITISVVDCLSLDGYELNELEIYPNPFDYFTTIQMNRNFEFGESILITDLQGRQVRSYTQLNGSQLKIAREDLVTGVYLLQLLDENGNKKAIRYLVVE